MDELFSVEGFVPRTMCGPSWTGQLIAVHRISDLIIFSCYLLMFGALFSMVHARKQLVSPVGLVVYALFILACGVTHLTNQMMFTWPAYRLDGAVKMVCAVISLIAAVWTYYPRTDDAQRL